MRNFAILAAGALLLPAAAFAQSTPTTGQDVPATQDQSATAQGDHADHARDKDKKDQDTANDSTTGAGTATDPNTPPSDSASEPTTTTTPPDATTGTTDSAEPAPQPRR